MEPVLFTLLITLLMVGAIAWVIFYLITLAFKLLIWVIKTPFRVGRHVMLNVSSRPVLTLRCANRRCGARLREEGRFCHRCGEAVATHHVHVDTPGLPRPASRVV